MGALMETENLANRNKGNAFWGCPFGWIGPTAEIDNDKRWLFFKDCVLVRFPIFCLTFNLWRPIKCYPLITARILYSIVRILNRITLVMETYAIRLERDWYDSRNKPKDS